MIVNIFDYKVGNIKSLYNFFTNALELKTEVVTQLSNKSKFDLLVFPGVGSFNGAMKNVNLKERDLIYNFAKVKKKNILGICLGMQILAKNSHESKNSKGLCLIDGSFHKIKETKNYKLPNVGWREIIIKKKTNFLSNLIKKHVYFDHSYYFKNDKLTLGYIKYGVNIPAIIQQKNITGFQFHPEKSQRAGLEITKKYIEKL